MLRDEFTDAIAARETEEDRKANNLKQVFHGNSKVTQSLARMPNGALQYFCGNNPLKAA